MKVIHLADAIRSRDESEITGPGLIALMLSAFSIAFMGGIIGFILGRL